MQTERERQREVERERWCRDKDIKRSSMEGRERVMMKRKEKNTDLRKIKEREKIENGVRFCSAPITKSKYLF